MLVDLMKYDTPLITFMDCDYYHASFIVSGIKLIDQDIKNEGTYILMVETNPENYPSTDMTLMEIKDYIEPIKQQKWLEVSEEEIAEILDFVDEDGSIFNNCDDCGKEIEHGSGNYFFLEPNYYNVDQVKVVCENCYEKYKEENEGNLPY